MPLDSARTAPIACICRTRDKFCFEPNRGGPAHKLCMGKVFVTSQEYMKQAQLSLDKPQGGLVGEGWGLKKKLHSCELLVWAYFESLIKI